MGAAYLPVKVSLIVILIVGMVYAITNLAPEINRVGRSNINFVIVSIIQVIILIIGLIGAIQDKRQYLLTYSIAILVLIVLAIVQSHSVAIVGNAVLDLVSIFLALWQSEMIRTGG